MTKEEDEKKKALEDLTATGKDPEACRRILAMLFPRVENILQTFVPTDTYDVKTRVSSRRVSQRDFAETYFNLSLQPVGWGRVEFQRLIEQSPKDAFSGLAKRLKSANPRNQSRLRRLFIELLDTAFSLNKTLTQEWLDALLQESSQLLRAKDEDQVQFFSFDNSDRLRWLIMHALEKIGVEERAKLFRQAIKKAKDLTLLTDVVRGVGGDVNPKGAKAPKSDITFGSHASEIRDLLLKRIRELARSKKIWDQAHPGRLLWFWWGCDQGQEVRAFTSGALKSKKGLLGLLNCSVSLIKSTAGNYERVDRRQWNEVVDLDALSDAARKLAKSQSRQERQLAERFLNGLARFDVDPH